MRNGYELERSAAITQRFWAEAASLLPLLGAKPHWLVGLSRVLADSLQRLELTQSVSLQGLSDILYESMGGCGGWGGTFACHSGASNFTLTTTEPYIQPWASLPPHRAYTVEPGSQPGSQLATVSVPYMTHTHFTASAYMDGSPSRAALLADKRFAVSMVFTEKRNPALRSMLLHQCAQHQEGCLSSMPSADVHSWVGLYRASWFCVMPSGDTPSRAALYECAALGTTIPVILDPVLVKLLPFADVLDWPSLVEVVSSPQAVLEEGLDLVAHLQAIPMEIRLHKVQKLHAIRHVFQWAAMPDHTLVERASLHQVQSRDDAFTSSVKAVVRNLCGRRLLRTNICL